MKRAPIEVANVERPIGDKPAPLPPLIPDYVPPERPWLGSAVGAVDHWRRRALAAEAEARALREKLQATAKGMSNVGLR